MYGFEKKVLLLSLLCCTTAVMFCSNDPVSSNILELTTLEKKLVASDNRFGLTLFKTVAAGEHGKNVFISPLSISMALGMTLNGAAGGTRDAMAATLELSDLSSQEINQSYLSLIEGLSQLDPKVVFEIANSIWYRNGYTFKDDFLQTNTSYFKAVVESLNFNSPAAVQTINNWVADKTHERIDKIVETINPEIVMFLINAIYFKGSWTTEFDKNQTHDTRFHSAPDNSIPVKMMRRTDKFDYFETEQMQAIELPYGDAGFSMLVILPGEGIDIDSMVQDLDETSWQQWHSNLSSEKVSLFLPKFKLEYEKSLRSVLTDMGMGVAFKPNEADFSNMYAGAQDLYISEVKHKTFVQVDEEGTEAAAVTSVEIGVTSAPVDEIVMRVDRPFIFSIRENQSGMILFIGKVTRPQA
jgi:serpin B